MTSLIDPNPFASPGVHASPQPEQTPSPLHLRYQLRMGDVFPFTPARVLLGLGGLVVLVGLPLFSGKGLTVRDYLPALVMALVMVLITIVVPARYYRKLTPEQRWVDLWVGPEGVRSRASGTTVEAGWKDVTRYQEHRRWLIIALASLDFHESEIA